MITIISQHKFLEETLQQLGHTATTHTSPPSFDFTQNNLIIIDGNNNSQPAAMKFINNYSGLVQIIYLGTLDHSVERVITIAKPFDISLLANYINKSNFATAKLIMKPNIFFNPSLRLIIKLSATTKEITLTEKESELLLYLLNQNGKPVAKEKLLSDIFGYASGTDTHTIETHLYRLRSKISADLITVKDGWYHLV